jgi:hypothetical protein
MARSDNVSQLPPDLPLPKGDGACDHVSGMNLPSIGLDSTPGDRVSIREKVFYPVFPPDKSAGDVIDWLNTHRDRLAATISNS